MCPAIIYNDIDALHLVHLEKVLAIRYQHLVSKAYLV